MKNRLQGAFRGCPHHDDDYEACIQHSGTAPCGLEEERHPMRFVYTNWRGETSERRAFPISVRWGNTEWHPAPCWLMKAFDADKNAEREFAMLDMVNTPADASLARRDLLIKAEALEELIAETTQYKEATPVRGRAAYLAEKYRRQAEDLK